MGKLIHSLRLAGCTAFALMVVGEANAETAVDFDEPTFYALAESTRGFAFSLSQAATITHLGWFDHLGDGLNDAHQVAIWSSSGALLLSGNVAAGNADPLLGQFRYTNALTGSNLLSAGEYVIGGLATRADVFPLSSTTTGVTFGSGITYQGNRRNGTIGEFSFPSLSQPGLDPGVFAPNFRYSLGTVAAVPEPSTWGTMILGFGILGYSLRRRRLSYQPSYAPA